MSFWKSLGNTLGKIGKAAISVVAPVAKIASNILPVPGLGLAADLLGGLVAKKPEEPPASSPQIAQYMPQTVDPSALLAQLRLSTAQGTSTVQYNTTTKQIQIDNQPAHTPTTMEKIKQFWNDHSWFRWTVYGVGALLVVPVVLKYVIKMVKGMKKGF